MARLKDFEIQMCDDMHRYGKIVNDVEYTTKEGDRVRTFTIDYVGNRFVLNKFNGEWNYIRRVIRQ